MPAVHHNRTLIGALQAQASSALTGDITRPFLLIRRLDAGRRPGGAIG